MDMQRQEYPALLSSLQPSQAVAVVNDRVRLIGKINADIADWLQERRRVEEAYVQGLKKLAGRRHHETSPELGIFQTPWQSIVSSTETLAQSHNMLAQRIEADVERPLREYQTKNREMQSMNTIQGNLAAMAREIEAAQKRSDKVKEKAGKMGRTANAESDLEVANQQWNSQAPFVFEQLQALDETRINHLRDVLTQLETHEVDQIERSRITAESCLNALLNVDTADEISTFVARISASSSNTTRPTVPSRQQSRGATLSPPPPSTGRDDRNSERSLSSPGVGRSGSSGAPQEQKHGRLSGLKRLGTVIGRGRSKPEPASPEKRSRSNLNPLRRGESSGAMQTIPSRDPSITNLASSPPRQERMKKQAPETPRSNLEAPRRADYTNGDAIEPAPLRFPGSGTPNGVQLHPEVAQLEDTQLPSLESRPVEKSVEVQRDAEGFSVPTSSNNDISRAQQEALASEAEQPQFKLDIRNEPIREEDGEAQTALSNVANTLRAQAQQIAPPRRLNTNRGRRDVRNTIFVPSPQTPENLDPTDTFGASASPMLATRPAALITEGHRGSDAQSVRSSHSLSSLAPNAVRHPDLHQPGLGASVVETISAWFSNGQVTKAVVIGELALAHNPTDAPTSLATESIRLENFPVLERVAPNPTFISQIPSRSGEYSVNLAQISRTTVAFKYQVHLEDLHLAAHAPMVLTPSWKIEATQASVILSYNFNPAFASAAKRSVSLKNVLVMINIENSRALSCQSRPAGTFSKEKSMIYWKMGDITLDGYAAAPQKLLARFATESEAKAGSVEVRWEISGDDAMGLGSGLSLSQSGSAREEGVDPFADEGVAANGSALWKEVPLVRKLVSGKYVAS
ncbi:Muniscin C-terminal [Lasallia pustulata]|uniref:Muniscin C-terminal n=1 Tax=Lasallia pustulata TaxID=136370 RepID=A0A1W5D3H8_9LECA|nr:Muniscin C-terminal [Lasallia pustulata]